MKKLIRLLALALFAISFQACSNDKESELDGNHRFDREEKPVLYKFRLALGGDYIEQTEEPLTKADETIRYAGINVTRLEKGASEANRENYAYGLFTTDDEIVINLESGYTYDFEATILRNKTDKYRHDRYNYPEPFVITETNYDNSNAYPYQDLNKFVYNNDTSNFSDGIKNRMCSLSSGTAYIDVYDFDEVASPHNYAYPRVHRYYGSLSNVDPANYVNNSKPIVIDLNYRCFGITIDAQDIPSGTFVTCRDISKRNDGSINNHLQFPKSLKLESASDKTGVWSEIFSLNNLSSDSEVVFDLEFTWNRGQNKAETIKSTITVKPKVNKILKLKIVGEANFNYTGNIILNESSSDLTDETEDIDYEGK